jgi:hypothetical protein
MPTKNGADVKRGRKTRLTEIKKMGYNNGNPVRCDCGKIVAYERNGKIYVYCKSCKRQIAVVRAKSH